MDPMEEQICVTLQMGVLKEQCSFERMGLDCHTLRDRAAAFVEKHCPSEKIPLDRILLFQHNYQSQNLLTLLQDADQLNNGAVVEVVISRKNELPSHPHRLRQHNYMTPTFCDFCGEMLVGLVRQGVKCEKCNLNFHKKCAGAPHNNCPVAATESGNSLEQPVPFSLPHTFMVHSYTKPTVCKICNNLLVGLLKQGLQCSECKLNVHKKCAQLAPFDCRISDLSCAHASDCAAATAPPEAMDVDALSSSLTLSSIDDDKCNLELIQLSRIPGQAAIRHSRARVTQPLMEGWLLHFTNNNPSRKRHFWTLDAAAITLYHNAQPQGTTRHYKLVPLGEILRVQAYDGAPLHPNGPPHCFEILTQSTIYYVGENLQWYAGNGPPPPSRESGVGIVSANKWLAAIQQALLPPLQTSHKITDTAAAAADSPEETQMAQQIALEFSQLYQFNQQEELGSGQFGTVYGGVHRSTGRKVAVKVILKSRFGRKQKEQLRSEVAILQNISFPGIITLEAMFETRDRIFVVMEKMEADMLEMILSNRQGRLSERSTKFLIAQILKALKYLHSQDIAHCDLKPENVLLNCAESEFPQTKLCDFGYARIIGENTFRKTVVGTPAYLAPEVLQKRGYNKSLDMWSVGVVIYVTLSGTFPFNEGEEITEQIQNAAFMYPTNPWSEITRDAIDLISKLLRVNMEERLIIDDCLAHAWLHDAQLYADLKLLEKTVNVNYLTDDMSEFGSSMVSS